MIFYHQTLVPLHLLSTYIDNSFTVQDELIKKSHHTDYMAYRATIASASYKRSSNSLLSHKSSENIVYNIIYTEE